MIPARSRSARLVRAIGPRTRVAVEAPEQVTQIGADELPAAEHALPEADVRAIWRAVTRYYEMGLQPAMALCVRHRGRVVLDRAIGHARGNAPGDAPDAERVAATPNTLFSLASGSKPVMAMAIHLLHERGLVHVDDRIGEHIEELARTDKAKISIRNLLSHRAGVPLIPPAKVNLEVLTDRDAILEAIAESPLSYRPGAATAYHALSAGFLVAEIVQRRTGRTLREFVREEIFEPAGIELSYGLAPERLDELAVDAFTGPTPLPLLARRLEASLGVSLQEGVRLSNDPRYQLATIPSGNVMGTASAAARFFDLLRCGGALDGVRVFAPETVARAVVDQGYRSFDRVLLLPVRYSMGFMLGGRRLSFFGLESSRAFGHLGFTNNLVWADPERELSVALLTSGKPFITPELAAWMAIPLTIAAKIPRARR